MDHIYHAAITINEGQKYGMSPEEIRLFCKWYTNLMAEKMEKTGSRLPYPTCRPINPQHDIRHLTGKKKSTPTRTMATVSILFSVTMGLFFVCGLKDEAEVFLHFFFLLEFCHVDISAH